LQHYKVTHGKGHDYNGIFASLGFVDGIDRGAESHFLCHPQ
jgi:hypothetical protein